MNRLTSFLNIDFLLKNNALKNWRMIIFLSLLALIMIASGHSADRKIFTIAAYNNELKALKSVFVEQKTRLMHVKKETTVVQTLRSSGLGSAQIPPIKIEVE